MNGCSGSIVRGLFNLRATLCFKAKGKKMANGVICFIDRFYCLLRGSNKAVLFFFYLISNILFCKYLALNQLTYEVFR